MKDAVAERLVRAAREVRSNAYAPYSGFQVGAALLATSGVVYLGVNVENAAYPSGLCAERAAVAAAVTAGERTFDAIAIVGGTVPAFPCGMCRQVLAELSPDLRVILAAAEEGQQPVEHSLSALLPHAFGPGDLHRGLA